MMSVQNFDGEPSDGASADGSGAAGDGVDTGLHEAILSLTASELAQLKHDAEASGQAGQLRDMVACVEQYLAKRPAS